MALMPPDNHYRISLEELKLIQQQAAQWGQKLPFYIHDERGQLLKTIQPPASSPPYPEGVNIAPQQRIGDEIRDKYFRHLHEMFAGGFIDQDEHDARVAAVLVAHTREELLLLVRDLPAMEEKKIEVAQPKPANRYVIRSNWSVVSLLAGLCAFCSVFPPYGIADGVVGVIMFSIAIVALIIARK